MRGCSVVSSLGEVLVPELGLHDLHRNTQRCIDRTMGRLWGGTLPNFHELPVAGREHHRHDLVGAELLAEAPPGRVRALVQELFLDGDQQVVGQDAQKNVRLGAPLQVVEDRTLHQRAFHGPKGGFHACQQGIGAPDLLRRQLVPIGLQHVAAIELLGESFLRCVLLPGEMLLGRVVRDPVVARDPGMALLEAPNPLMDLRRILQLPLRDPPAQSFEILQEPLLMRLSDRPIFLFPPFTQTQNVDVVALLPALDLHPRLVLIRVARRGSPVHFFPVVCL